ncbi:collagen alpha-1(I) chain-like [Vulpes lagopus]|uniref:collagen alpha-1(I) chain-like n=1 Tax=Vulpes lagopus TaxID=494514 RepID=UPI001BC939E0|nr:collagen alpha-1(I) chain-like [Vulpes lagopus]
MRNRNLFLESGDTGAAGPNGRILSLCQCVGGPLGSLRVQIGRRVAVGANPLRGPAGCARGGRAQGRECALGVFAFGEVCTCTEACGRARAACPSGGGPAAPGSLCGRPGPAEPAGLPRPRSARGADTERPRPARAFVFRPRPAPAAARLLARFWASPARPGRNAVPPGAGRAGRRCLPRTDARGRGDRWPGRVAAVAAGCARRAGPRAPAARGREGGGPRGAGLSRGPGAQPHSLARSVEAGRGGAAGGPGGAGGGPLSAHRAGRGREEGTPEGPWAARATPRRGAAGAAAWLQRRGRAPRGAGALRCGPRGRTASAPEALPPRPPKSAAGAGAGRGGGAASRPGPGLHRGRPEPPLGSFPSGRARGKEGGERARARAREAGEGAGERGARANRRPLPRLPGADGRGRAGAPRPAARRGRG